MPFIAMCVGTGTEENVFINAGLPTLPYFSTVFASHESTIDTSKIPRPAGLEPAICGLEVRRLVH